MIKDDFENLMQTSAEKLRAICEAMQRKGKSTLLDEKMADLLMKGYKEKVSNLKENQKGAA